MFMFYLSPIMRKYVLAICEEERYRSTCTSVQIDQDLYYFQPRKCNISRFYILKFKTSFSVVNSNDWFLVMGLFYTVVHVFSFGDVSIYILRTQIISFSKIIWPLTSCIVSIWDASQVNTDYSPFHPSVQVYCRFDFRVWHFFFTLCQLISKGQSTESWPRLPRKIVDRITDCLDMTSAVYRRLFCLFVFLALYFTITPTSPQS